MTKEERIAKSKKAAAVRWSQRDLTDEQKFLIRVDKNAPNGCWHWTGAKLNCGYGIMYPSRTTWRLAHRWAWELYRGPIPEGLLVCHHCDNRICCNPEHLFVGTYRDNSNDSYQKGRIGPREMEQPTCKLTNEQVLSIRSEYGAKALNQYQLADKYGVSQAHIHKIVTRQVRDWLQA